MMPIAVLELLDLGWLFPALIAAYAVLTWLVPQFLWPLAWLLLHGAYRFRSYHAERVPRTGPALIVCNHVSYIDGFVLWCACSRRVTFVSWVGYLRNPFTRLVYSWLRGRTVWIDNRAPTPHAVAAALAKVTAALDRGEVVIYFPEGRLTRNGQIQPFQRGLERILRQTKTAVPLIPACTRGLWGSVLSHKGGSILRKWPVGFRRPVSVGFGEPLPKDSTAATARAAVVECLADIAIRESDEILPVPRWFLRTASRWKNVFRPAAIDNTTGSERVLNGGKLIVACWCLADWLKKRLDNGTEPVGVWLPTGLGSALANVALGFLRRPAVNLNYTAGSDGVLAAARLAGLKTVITSKRFEAKIPLALPADIERIYLEDALAGISATAKALRFLAVLLVPMRLIERHLGLHRIRPDDLLTIVFSSGSTGEPKGVMLSHRNIAANCRAFEIGVDLTPHDIMLSTLPVFHSFGYTVCLWAPLGIGMTAVFHPDPRAAHEVGALCKKHRCTIMVGTATFLRFYLRRCETEDFRSLRLLICGAEKLPVTLAEEFRDRFGVLPLEGYGCTELSPVVGTNLHDTVGGTLTNVANRMGTVGRPLPGIAVRTVDPETRVPLPIDTEGAIEAKGPNVMLGYWQRPDLTAKVLRDGWYFTGDIGRVEKDGFLRITGRQSRFAKLAGEMVPLERIEDEMQEAFGGGERLVVVCAVPDDRRGERLVVLYRPEAVGRLDEVLKQLPARGLPNLWVPDRRDCYAVDTFPVLGSGKLDLKAVGALALKSHLR